VTHQRVRDVFPDAPVAKGVMVPAGWRLSPKGVQHVGAGGLSMTLPVILTERAVDVQRGTRVVTVAWFADGRWHTRDVDRDVIASARSVVDLAAYGLPVNSNNARDVVAYLADFEAANPDALPATQVARQLGWQGPEGKDRFLWGKALITAKGIQAEEAGGALPRGGRGR
jgi:hypothetical protein